MYFLQIKMWFNLELQKIDCKKNLFLNYILVLQFGIKMQQFAPAKINPVINTVLISCMADNVVIYL